MANVRTSPHVGATELGGTDAAKLRLLGREPGCKCSQPPAAPTAPDLHGTTGRKTDRGCRETPPPLESGYRAVAQLG